MGAKSPSKDSETAKSLTRQPGIDRMGALLQDLGAKSPSKDSETAKDLTRQSGIDERMHSYKGLGAKSPSENPKTLKGLAKYEGFETAKGPVKESEEESGRKNRCVQNQEQGQKSWAGRTKDSPEDVAQKGLGSPGHTQRAVAGIEEARSETEKVKVIGGDLTHKKVEKTESNSGENSNLSSRNYPTFDKGAGVDFFFKRTASIHKIIAGGHFEADRGKVRIESGKRSIGIQDRSQTGNLGPSQNADLDGKPSRNDQDPDGEPLRKRDDRE